MEFFDSHSHMSDDKFEENREELLKQTYEAGVTRLVSAGYDILSSKKAIEIAEENKFIYATCGISPNDISKIEEKNYEELYNLGKNKKVVAIGEIGLDYYWNKENKEDQKKAFIRQIDIANSLDLPIQIHTRDAVLDTIDILKNKIVCKQKGVFHCCPQNLELIKEGLKLGFYISFAGPITFKNSKNADLAIREVPLERLLIETDSPYLSPEPLRGTVNDSRNVKYIAKKIAEVKQVPLEQVAKATYDNALAIFRIKN